MNIITILQIYKLLIFQLDWNSTISSRVTDIIQHKKNMEIVIP